MKEKGRAAVWVGPKKLEIREYPIPEVEKDTLLVKVEACGVCGTDRSLYTRKPKFPTILGHEVAGEIVAMGPQALSKMKVAGGSLKIGDRIGLYPWIPCGRCWSCLRFGPAAAICEVAYGYGSLSDHLALETATSSSQVETEVSLLNGKSEEYPHFKGGFASHFYIHPGTYLWKVPEDMSSEIMALLDPMGVAVRAVEVAKTCSGRVESALTHDATVVVQGSGMIGILVAMVAKMAGASKIIMTGGGDKRLKLAKDVVDIDQTINIFEKDVDQRVEIVKDMTGGRGADLVFECCGVPEAVLEALRMARRMSTVVSLGNLTNPGQYIKIDPCRDLVLKHVTLQGMVANPPRSFDQAFAILDGFKHKIPFEKLITHKFPVKDTIKALDASTDVDNCVKAMMINK